MGHIHVWRHCENCLPLLEYTQMIACGKCCVTTIGYTAKIEETSCLRTVFFHSDLCKKLIKQFHTLDVNYHIRHLMCVCVLLRAVVIYIRVIRPISESQSNAPSPRHGIPICLRQHNPSSVFACVKWLYWTHWLSVCEVPWTPNRHGTDMDE